MEITATAGVRDAKITGLVSAGHFFGHFYWLALPPLFPLLLVEFDVSYTALGLLVSAMSVASGTFQLPMGFLVDRFGPALILAAGLALEAAAILLVGFAGSYWLVLVLVVLAGMGNSVFHPADYSILSASIRRDRLGRAFSAHSFAGHSGWAAAPLVMGAFAASIGWRTGLAVVGLAGLATALLILANHGLLNLGRMEGPEGPAAPGARGRMAIAGGLRLLLTRPILMCFLFFVLLATAVSGFGTFLASAFVTHHGTSLPAANLAMTALFGGGAFGILAGGVIADRTSRHALVVAVFLAAAGALIVLAGSQGLPVAALIALVAGAGFASGMVAPSRDLIVRAVTPEGATGKVFGFVSVGLDVGGVLTPLVFGWIMDTGDTRWLFWLTAVFLAAAIATAFGTRTGKGE